MKFKETPIDGAWLVELTKFHDERGFFARAWCQNGVGKQGITSRIAQVNNSYGIVAGTIRGLHYQVAPYEEMKGVRCIRGEIFDVLVDLRPESASYLGWYGTKLTAENRTMLCVPEGCAHGFQTLCDDTEVLYLVTSPYNADAERGARWDDPILGIDWPLPVSSISQKDATWPPILAERT